MTYNGKLTILENPAEWSLSASSTTCSQGATSGLNRRQAKWLTKQDQIEGKSSRLRLAAEGRSSSAFSSSASSSLRSIRPFPWAERFDSKVSSVSCVATPIWSNCLQTSASSRKCRDCVTACSTCNMVDLKIGFFSILQHWSNRFTPHVGLVTFKWSAVKRW